MEEAPCLEGASQGEGPCLGEVVPSQVEASQEEGHSWGQMEVDHKEVVLWEDPSFQGEAVHAFQEGEVPACLVVEGQVAHGTWVGEVRGQMEA